MPPRSRLRWWYNPPEEVSIPADSSEVISLPHNLVRGLGYHMRLGFVDGELVAEITDRVRWVIPTESNAIWGSMVQIGETTAFTVDAQAFALTSADTVVPAGRISSEVGETRTWQLEGDRVPSVGVCLPYESRITWGTVLPGRATSWPSNIGRNPIGPRIGELTRDLYQPRSFDVAPDGRLYILDSGNHRVVVLSLEGEYITEWGGRGDGPGELDLGPGGIAYSGSSGYWGSICVDDEGFIYVADVFNRRIQKFAPE